MAFIIKMKLPGRFAYFKSFMALNKSTDLDWKHCGGKSCLHVSTLTQTVFFIVFSVQIRRRLEFIAFPYLVSKGMLLFSTQLSWSCAWSVLELVSAPWTPWLAWHRVGMVFLCRLTWVYGAGRAQVQACGGGGGGGNGRNVNWPPGLLGNSG